MKNIEKILERLEGILENPETVTEWSIVTTDYGTHDINWHTIHLRYDMYHEDIIDCPSEYNPSGFRCNIDWIYIEPDSIYEIASILNSDSIEEYNTQYWEVAVYY